MNYEYQMLKHDFERKIESGKAHKDENGLYKFSKKFDDFDKRLYVRATSAEDGAHKMLELKKKKLSEKRSEDKSGIRFDVVAEEWFRVKVEDRGLSEDNIKNNLSLLNNILLPRFGTIGIKKISSDDAQSFINEIGKKYSKSHATKVRNTLFNIFKYAISKNYLNSNPADDISMPNCVIVEQPDKLPPDEDALVMRFKVRKDDTMMLLALCLQYIYGMRTIEIRNLQWKYIDFDNDRFFISVSKYKNANYADGEEIYERYLPLCPTITELLKRHRRWQQKNNLYKDDGFLFLGVKSKKPISTKQLDEYFQTITRDVDIANGAVVYNNKIIESTNVRHVVPYAFRKMVMTKFTAMNYNDAITQRFVGHKPRSVKDRNYTKFNFERDLRPHYEKYMKIADKDLLALLHKAGIKIGDSAANTYTSEFTTDFVVESCNTNDNIIWQ